MIAENFRADISSWDHLSELLAYFSRYAGHDWLFRGVTKEAYTMRPKIGRKSARLKAPYRINDERAVLTMFKQQARAHVTGSPTELEWLAIAQHHGLPTRLLDWTDSLFISAWFAVEVSDTKAGDSAIWVTKDVPFIDGSYSGEVLTLADARIFRPPHISPRIGAQGSVLMICPTPCSDVSLPFRKKDCHFKQRQVHIEKIECLWD